MKILYSLLLIINLITLCFCSEKIKNNNDLDYIVDEMPWEPWQPSKYKKGEENNKKSDKEFSDKKISDFIKTFLKLTDLAKAQNIIDKLNPTTLELIHKYINAPIDHYNNTLLHKAKTSLEVQLLLLLGADPNLMNKCNETPLASMLYMGQKDLAYALLQDSPKLNIMMFNQEEFGPSPLHYAAAYGYNEIIRILISRGADINAYYNEFSPLTIAMDRKQLDTVKLLINLGADIYSGTPAGTRVLVPYELNDLLNMDSCDIQGYTPLMSAAMSDCPENIELLLSYGVDVNQSGPWGFSSLMFACLDFNPKTVELLLTAGADPKICTKNGVTPLLLASFIPKLPIVEQLLKSGALINQPYTDNFFMRMFLSSDLIVNLKGFSPLLLIIRMGLKLSKMLIDHGADIHQVTDEGISALMLAIVFEPELVPLLIEKEINVNHATTKQSPIVQILLGDFLMKQGRDRFDQQTASASGFTALMLATALGKVDIVKLLIKAGADVNAQNSKGLTALMFANAHSPICAKLLVDADAK